MRVKHSAVASVEEGVGQGGQAWPTSSKEVWVEKLMHTDSSGTRDCLMHNKTFLDPCGVLRG